MRVFFLLLLIMGVGGCRKDTGPDITRFFGQWELRTTITIAGLTHFPPGNGSIIEFARDSIFNFSNGIRSTGISYRYHRVRAWVSNQHDVFRVTLSSNPG